MKLKKALLLVGHGSRRKGFQRAMERVAGALERGRGWDAVDCAYLEITPPLISDAIDRLCADGASEVTVIPYFLLSGRHTAEHIPKIVSDARKRWRGRSRIKLGPYLGYHKKIADIVAERAGQAR